MPAQRDRLLDRARHAEERRQRVVGPAAAIRASAASASVERVGEAVAGERVGARLAGVQAVDVRLHDLARGQLAGRIAAARSVALRWVSCGEGAVMATGWRTYRPHSAGRRSAEGPAGGLRV